MCDLPEKMFYPVEGRHKSVMEIMRYFEWTHLPKPLSDVSERFYTLAHDLLSLPDSAELVVSLRKLLEAKDAAVRAALDLPRG